MIADISQAGVRLAIANRCNGKAGLAKHADKKQLLTATAVDYTVRGVWYNLTAQAAIVTAQVAQALQAEEAGISYKKPVPINAGCTRVYAVCADKQGKTHVFEPDGVQPGTSSNKTPRIHWSTAPIGALKIECAKTLAAPFVLGVTAFDAAGVTATATDISVLWETL